MHHFLSLITVCWLLITTPWKFYNFDAVFLKLTRHAQCKAQELCLLSPLVADTCRSSPGSHQCLQPLVLWSIASGVKGGAGMASPGLVQREGTTERAAFMGCNMRDPSGTWKTNWLWTAAQNTGQDSMQIIEVFMQVTRLTGFLIKRCPIRMWPEFHYFHQKIKNEGGNRNKLEFLLPCIQTVFKPLKNGLSVISI